MPGAGSRYLVVVADDFGRSSSINRAVAEAHERGILTAASIMAGGKAVQEAVRIARRMPTLSVGLHLTLCDGTAVLPPSEIPDLAGEGGHFSRSPARAWINYYRRGVLPQLEREIAAQFDRLAQAGIEPSHVDGHHHLHLHPAVFPVLCRIAAGRGVRWVRIPEEPFRSAIAPGGRGLIRILEWIVFALLRPFHRGQARAQGLRGADRTYGLSRTGRLDERHLLGVLRQAGRVTEIFAHPDAATEAGRREADAIISPAVRRAAQAAGITLTGYRDLPARTVVMHGSGERI